MEDLGNSITTFNPDIRRLVDSINIGPQSIVSELIEEFNNSYIRQVDHLDRYYNLQAPTKNLGITKKFYWKPGAYDTIKDILWHQSELHKKATSLSKVVTRLKDASNWRMRTIIQQLDAIESILIDFRQRGVIMQDNTDDAVEAWEIIRNHLIHQYENSNGAFHITIEEHFSDMDNDDLLDYYINISYLYDDIYMEYKHHNSDHRIAEIFMPGEGHLTVKIPLSRLLNLTLLARNDLTKLNISDIICSRQNNRRWFYKIGGNYESYEGIEHPYISKTTGHWNQNGYTDHDFKYVCVGNMETEIRGCLKSLDFISLTIFFDRIMTHYDTNTGPLNRINESYHGEPSFLDGNEEYYNIIPKITTSNCRYYMILDEMIGDEARKDSYCAKWCTIKDKCDLYISKTRILSKEEVERIALEQATINAARRIQ